jgi:site-specific recombinase XerD
VGQRDKVLFNLLYGCGLRVAEAVALQVEDVDFAEGFLRVVGKGNKERRVYLKPVLLGLLREYVVSRQLTGYLFPGNAAGHLTTRSVHYRLRHYARKAGLKRKISPHILRHSIAVHYLQGGAPVSFVQGLLGHASLATTGVYLQLTDQMAKEITLKTETALERLTQGERELREARMVYDAGIVEWDGYVAEVLEWLVVNCPSAP